MTKQDRDHRAYLRRAERNRAAGLTVEGKQPKQYAGRYPHGTPPLMRLMRRVVTTEAGCWEWTGPVHGPTHGRGYARIEVGDDTRVLGHRLAYEEMVGPIPAGLTLDHLCLNTLCVNPEHLEPVTFAENTRRARAAVV